MIPSFIDTIRRYAERPLTRQILLDVLKGYKHLYDNLHELVRNRKISAGIFRYCIYTVNGGLPDMFVHHPHK